MIETVRAALVAGSIAESAEFFSFGTNDLTQVWEWVWMRGAVDVIIKATGSSLPPQYIPMHISAPPDTQHTHSPASVR